MPSPVTAGRNGRHTASYVLSAYSLCAYAMQFLRHSHTALSLCVTFHRLWLQVFSLVSTGPRQRLDCM